MELKYAGNNTLGKKGNSFDPVGETRIKFML